MIAARMDPKQRAGETAKSNVKNAQNFGRGHMLGLAMLLKAGLITGKVMDSKISWLNFSKIFIVNNFN